MKIKSFLSCYGAIVFLFIITLNTGCASVNDLIQKGDSDGVYKKLSHGEQVPTNRISMTISGWGKSTDLSILQWAVLKKSADIEYKDTYHMTALHYACDKGFYDIVKILVNSGADINSRGYKNCTPVYYAIGVENTDIVKYLIEKKARFDVVNDNSETPVSYAITNSLKTKNLSIVKLLIENGADVNSRNNNDIPFIMLAAAYGNTEMLKFLIDRGADVNIAYQANITALINAALNNKLECVKILVENGADTTGKIIKDFTFNGDDFKAGSTALDLAKQLEYDEISEYLSNTSNIKRNARKKQNSSDDFNTTMPWDKFFLVLLDISEQKNPEKIIKLCIKYSKNYANSEEDRFEALTNAGRISYYVKKKPKEAIVLLKKAILLNLHGSSFALGILGSSYMAISTNDPQLQEKALICLQLASKTGSDNPGINHDLARAYSLFNDSEKAFYYYIKAISNNNGKFLSDVQTDPAFKNMISSPEFKKFYNNRNTFQSNITAFENAVNQKKGISIN